MGFGKKEIRKFIDKHPSCPFLINLSIMNLSYADGWLAGGLNILDEMS